MHVLPAVRLSRTVNYSAPLRNLYTLLLWPIRIEVSVWIRHEDLLSFSDMSTFYRDHHHFCLPTLHTRVTILLKVQRLIEALFDVQRYYSSMGIQFLYVPNQIYSLNVCVPQPPSIKTLISNVILFEGLKEVMRGEPHNRTDALTKAWRDQKSLSLDQDRTQQRAGLCEPGGGLSPEPDHPDTLTVSRAVRSSFLLFKPPAMYRFNTISSLLVYDLSSPESSWQLHDHQGPRFLLVDCITIPKISPPPSGPRWLLKFQIPWLHYDQQEGRKDEKRSILIV